MWLNNCTHEVRSMVCTCCLFNMKDIDHFPNTGLWSVKKSLETAKRENRGQQSSRSVTVTYLAIMLTYSSSHMLSPSTVLLISFSSHCWTLLTTSELTSQGVLEADNCSAHRHKSTGESSAVAPKHSRKFWKYTTGQKLSRLKGKTAKKCLIIIP